MVEKSIVLRALEALKKACRDLQSCGGGATDYCEDNPYESPSMKALLALETESEKLFSGDPHLYTLFHLLSRLRSLASAYSTAGRAEEVGLHSPLSFILGALWFRRRRSITARGEISKVAGSIESEIQSWIDRESLDRLADALRQPCNSDEDEISTLLSALESRLTRGFDRGLQDALLRSRTFESVESALANPSTSKRVKDQCAVVVAAMVRFNRDVFVGLVLMGRPVRLLVGIATLASMSAVHSLVRSIKTPIIDEMESTGEIPRIVGLLEADEKGAAAMEVLMDMAYYGRKEAVEAMMEAGVIGRLVALQRSEFGGALIEESDGDEEDREERKGVRAGGVVEKWKKWRRWRPFASCVARFAVQLEVGEGMRRRGKMGFKAEVLRRVREAVSSEAEEATIVAEVLWGSTP